MSRSPDSLQVVLLHGVGLDRTLWGPVEQLLHQQGWTTTALDLPGHGRRPALRRPTDLAEMAHEVAGQITTGPVHLVGFSLGALVAQRIAMDHPELVSTLSCVSGVCRRTEDESAAVAHRLATAGEDFEEGVDRALERWFPRGARVSDSQREATRATLLANDRQSYLYAYAVFATGDQDIAGDLDRIQAPVLAITGELDPGSTPEMTERLASVVPDGRAVVVPQARHMLPVERPADLTDQLTGHFAAHTSPQSSPQHTPSTPPEGAHRD